MVLLARPIVQSEKGAIEGAGGVHLGDGVWIMHAAAAPTAGASGDGAGWAAKGSLYIDSTNGKLYINTNTTASPTWTLVGSQS